MMPVNETWKSGLSSVEWTQQIRMTVRWGTEDYEKEECEVHWLWGGRIVREVDRDGPTKKRNREDSEREAEGKRSGWEMKGWMEKENRGVRRRDGRGNGGGERKRGRQGAAYSGKRLQVVLSGPKVHGGGRAGEQVSQACMCLSLTWISFCLHSFTVASGFCPPPLLKHTLPHTASLMPPTPHPNIQTHTHTRTRTHTHERTHAHTHTHTHTYKHTHTHTHTYKPTHTHIQTHAHAHTHARTHAHHTHTHTPHHTHTHT